MKSIATAILAGGAFLALNAAVIDLNCRWAGKVPFSVDNGVLSVSDDSETSGKYLLSPVAIPILPGKPLVIRLEAKWIKNLLDEIQQNIFKKAKDARDARIYECNNYEEFKERVKDGGFFLCHWDGTAETEAKIKEETQATIRCVPFGVEQTPGVDMVSGKPSVARVLIARSY